MCVWVCGGKGQNVCTCESDIQSVVAVSTSRCGVVRVTVYDEVHEGSRTSVSSEVSTRAHYPREGP